MQDCYAGADPRYRLPVRIITEQAWHSLFARHMFIDVPDADRHARGTTPEFTVIDTPGLHADPAVHGTNSEVFILLNFAKRLVLIGGTSYAGEIKKSIFTVMNYLLPLRDVHVDALLGERRQRRRRGAVLRPVRHRQDDAVERSRAAA